MKPRKRQPGEAEGRRVNLTLRAFRGANHATGDRPVSHAAAASGAAPPEHAPQQTQCSNERAETALEADASAVGRKRGRED